MMTRGCIALFCQVLLASAGMNEIPCTSEDPSTCPPSEAGLGDDTNILIQQKVDTSKHEQRIGAQAQSSHNWVVKPNLFSDTMTMTVRVKIGGAFQTEGTLAAFGPFVKDDVASQIRGVQSNPGTSPIPGVGKIYQITMYANAGGELLTFRFKKNGHRAKVTTLKPTKIFQVNGNFGNARTPIDLEEDGDAWDVDPALFSDSMTMTAQIKIDDVVQSSGVLAAFSGSQVRGVHYLSGKGPFASVGAIYLITLYGNQGGDNLKFQFKDGNGKVSELAEEVEFVINGNIGNARKPEAFTQALPPTPAPPPAQAPLAPAPACPDAADAEVKAWSTKKWQYAMGCAEVKQWLLCTDSKGQPAPEVPKYCAATCGFPCPPPTTPVAPPSCADKTAQEVGDWTASMWGAGTRLTCAQLDSYQLCVAADHKVKMAEYCAKTCKAC